MSKKIQNTKYAHPRRNRHGPRLNFGNVHILNKKNIESATSPIVDEVITSPKTRRNSVTSLHDIHNVFTHPFTPIVTPASVHLDPQDVRVATNHVTKLAQRRFEFGVTKNSVNPTQLPDGSWSLPLLDKSVIWRIYEAAPPTGKFNFVNTELQSHGLHTIPDYAHGRILIDEKTTNRDSGYMQYIGSILHVTDEHIKIVSTMQPVTMVTNRILPNIIKNWQHFDLICAEDGATIGLYWFNNTWVIRTINSFDASNIVWNDRATFGQMINDIMRKYPQFRYDALDKTKSYTFGIKHPAIHAYHEMMNHPITRAWFIQCTDIDKINRQCGVFNGTISFDESIGLELQLSATSKTFSSMSDVDLSRDPKYNITGTQDQVKSSKSDLSLADVLNTTRGALGSVVTNSSNSAVRYFGIILRSKKVAYFIPSDLYEYIATTCYTREIVDLLGNEKFNRYKFIILFNSLCPEDERDIFMCIYPSWTHIIGRIREFLSKSFASTMFDVYDHLTNGAKLPDVSENTLCLARSIVINWARMYGVPGKNERAKITNMYADYVMQKQHARVLYNLVWDEINIEVNDYEE